MTFCQQALFSSATAGPGVENTLSGALQALENVVTLLKSIFTEEIRAHTRSIMGKDNSRRGFFKLEEDLSEV